MSVLSAGESMAAPEPSPVPKRWQLDVSPSPLRLVVLTGPDGRVRPFFFMSYTVTNNSGQDLLFAPMFELATDAGELVRSGRDVPVWATQQIMARVGNPLAQDQIAIVGTLLRGEENARDGVVIWAAPTLQLSELIVYGAGFSGETATVEVPNPETGQMERKVLRKTLELRYRMEGDLTVSSPGGIEPIERRWIMR